MQAVVLFLGIILAFISGIIMFYSTRRMILPAFIFFVILSLFYFIAFAVMK